MIRYYYIQANRDKYPIAKMVRWAKVSRSGFYAWLRRKPSLRDKTNADLLQQIQKSMMRTIILMVRRVSHGNFAIMDIR